MQKVIIDINLWIVMDFTLLLRTDWCSSSLIQLHPSGLSQYQTREKFRNTLTRPQAEKPVFFASRLRRLFKNSKMTTRQPGVRPTLYHLWLHRIWEIGMPHTRSEWDARMVRCWNTFTNLFRRTRSSSWELYPYSNNRRPSSQQLAQWGQRGWKGTWLLLQRGTHCFVGCFLL